MATDASVVAGGGLGLVACTALVVGNMIGSGIFLPASLAAFGPISLVGWTVTSIGALVLAVIFGRLSRVVTKTGGPYAYTEAGSASSPASSSPGATGSRSGPATPGWRWRSPATSASSFPASRVLVGELAVALIAIWTLTLVNIRGVAEAGGVQVVTTVLKLVPLVLIGTLGPSGSTAPTSRRSTPPASPTSPRSRPRRR